MIILNNIIYVANIGDSKAVVARKKEDGSFSPLCLTVDHNPMAHDERMRIQKTGAIVKDGRINGVIEVSRSIGDVPFKSLGCICTPDFKKLTLTPNDFSGVGTTSPFYFSP
uniref:PPM-type phosphatase domain-containing protein n=1 Tax=Caenorhabditis japonica TaxID=281687 RepID=A0A8R1DT06_CAEJA